VTKKEVWNCCNLSGGVALIVWFTTNGMCVKNNTIVYVARTRNNNVISSGGLYCCLLPRCEALRTCRSGFPIATKWCCDQDVKVVWSSTFTQRKCDRCGSLWKGGDVVATSPVVLRWLCDSPRTGCAWRITPLCMWREQAIIEWSRRVISIVACCHGAKLCAHAARDFRSQQN